MDALVPAFAAGCGIPAEDQRRLGAVLEGLVRFTLDHAYPDDDLGEIEVTLEAGDGAVHVTVHDWGVPLFSAGGEFGSLPEPLATVAAQARDVLLTNLGSNGKRLTAELDVDTAADRRASVHHIDAASRRAATDEAPEHDIEVRAATAGDAVTIHPFSQRVVLADGFRETAIQLGMFPAHTTMRGFGGDAPRRRTATIRSYLPFDEGPRRVALPTVYRDLLEGLYANAGLTIDERTESAPFEGEAVTADVDEARALGFLRLRRWETGTGAALKVAVRRLLSRHIDVAYAYADVDLMAVADVDAATAVLNELGFFLAGLVLHGLDGHDYLRLQLLDTEDVELDEMVCDSAFTQELRQQVLTDKDRVG